MFINAHTFTTEQEANAAIDLINHGEGIPVNDEAATRTYTEAHVNKGTIYIVADEVTEKYLGASVEIEIIHEDL
jgi:hypothetical protein